MRWKSTNNFKTFLFLVCHSLFRDFSVLLHRTYIPITLHHLVSICNHKQLFLSDFAHTKKVSLYWHQNKMKLSVGDSSVTGPKDNTGCFLAWSIVFVTYCIPSQFKENQNFRKYLHKAKHRKIFLQPPETFSKFCFQ